MPLWNDLIVKLLIYYLELCYLLVNATLRKSLNFFVLFMFGELNNFSYSHFSGTVNFIQKNKIKN